MTSGRLNAGVGWNCWALSTSVKPRVGSNCWVPSTSV